MEQARVTVSLELTYPLVTLLLNVDEAEAHFVEWVFVI